MRLTKSALPLILAATAGCTLLPTFGTTTSTPSAKTALIVVNSVGKTLSRIDLENGQVVENLIGTGLYPNQILVKGTKGYLVNSGDNEVAVLDLAGNLKEGGINLPANSNPYQMTFGPTDRALVANSISNKVALLDLANKTVLKEVAMATPGATSVAYSNGKYYVSCVNTDYSGYPNVQYGAGIVYVLKEDTLEKLAEINVGNATNPQFLAVDPSGEVQVICTGNYTGTGKIVVINPTTDTIKTTIAVGGAPGAIAFLGNKAYLADSTLGVLSYDWNQETVLRDASHSITVGSSPMGLVADSKYVYVANFGSDNIQAIDPSTDATVSEWKVGDGPLSLAIAQQ